MFAFFDASATGFENAPRILKRPFLTRFAFAVYLCYNTYILNKKKNRLYQEGL
jgi:hypothetical protein